MAIFAYKRCIFFLADGSRADLIDELIAAGELPNVARYLSGGGLTTHATTVFPSTTGPAYLPFLTGRYPGPCNMPGIRWFDRTRFAGDSPFSVHRTRSYCGIGSRYFNRDLNDEISTVFDVASKPLNLYNPITRGLARNRERYKLGLDHVVSHFTADHRWTHNAVVRGLMRALSEDFDFLFAVFPGPDTVGHYDHWRSDRAVAAYKEIDAVVGQVMDRLTRLGQADDTMLFLSADHGMTETHTHFDVARHLDELGFRTYYHPRIFRHWRNPDAACMVSGNSMAHLYFRNGKSWADRMPFEELNTSSAKLGGLTDELLSKESIEMVVGLGSDDAVRVKTRKGVARIERTGSGRVRYSVEQGADPFGYEQLPAVMDEREALRRTHDSAYPDALVQLLQIYDSPRTGDLIVCASNGHDLRERFESPEHRGSHGALTREQMVVPFLTNCELACDAPFRTVDFLPTAYTLLGWEAPQALDGMDLSRIRPAEEAA